MNALPFTIHVGYVKTGTTTLQRGVFERHSGALYLGRDYSDKELQGAVMDAIFKDSAYRDASKLAEHFAEAGKRAAGEGKALVLSDERLLGFSQNKGETLARLAEASSGCKVLITIREQKNLLRSFYVRHAYMLKNAPRSHKLSFVPFLDWLDFESKLGNGRRIALESLEYSAMAACCERLFGEGNVGIFPLEELAADLEGYGNRLAAFLGIDPGETTELLKGQRENRGGKLDRDAQRRLSEQWYRDNGGPLSRLAPGAASSLRRKLNKLAPSMFPLLEQEELCVLPDEWMQRLDALYAPGNAALAERYGLPLQEYGYPV